jgi:hypothetical protein
MTVVGITLGWFLGGVLTPYLQALFNVPDAHTELTVGIWPVGVAMAKSVAAVAATVGLTVGVCQWLILRRVIKNAQWWVLVSLVSWGVGGAVYWIVYWLMGGPFSGPYSYWTPEQWTGWTSYFTAMFAGWVVGGILVGLMSAVGLNLLLIQNNKKRPFATNSKEQENSLADLH